MLPPLVEEQFRPAPANISRGINLSSRARRNYRAIALVSSFFVFFTRIRWSEVVRLRRSRSSCSRERSNETLSRGYAYVLPPPLCAHAAAFLSVNNGYVHSDTAVQLRSFYSDRDFAERYQVRDRRSFVSRDAFVKFVCCRISLRGLYFSAELVALVRSVSFSLRIRRRRINFELVQPVQLKRTDLMLSVHVLHHAHHSRLMRKMLIVFLALILYGVW